MTDDTIESLRAKIAEAERQRDDARAEAREHNESHVTVADLLTVAQSRAERAEAAWVEMRAALEREHDDTHAMHSRSTCPTCALLARTDLGRGMVVVPLGLLRRVRYCLRRDSYDSSPDGMKVCRDLDALLDGGKERG